MKKQGFTILQILVVIMIIAVIIAFAIPRGQGMRDEANILKAKKALKAIQAALLSYHTNHRAYPPQTDTITADLQGAFPQILDQVMYDPFGASPTSEYLYTVTDDLQNYALSSAGPDRVNGTARIVSLGDVPSSGDDFLVTNGTVTELDADTDTNNCGSIGTVCENDETCSAGVCAADCTPACSGKNCGDDGCGGSCGPCSGAGQTCDESGICCGQVADGEDCSVGSDCQNGYCGLGRCSGGQNDSWCDDNADCVSQNCDSGMCYAACAPECSGNGQACCLGWCSDTRTDYANCGACGNWCQEGQLCENSNCRYLILGEDCSFYQCGEGNCVEGFCVEP